MHLVGRPHCKRRVAENWTSALQEAEFTATMLMDSNLDTLSNMYSRHGHVV